MESIATFRSSYSCDIGFNRSILVECKAGKAFIDFATVNIVDGVPCKVRNKSMRIPISIWNTFMDEIDEIEENFHLLCCGEDLKFHAHLGSNIHLSMNSGVLCVDLRTFYSDKNGQLQPGQPGVSFKLHEFQELLKILEDINEKITYETEPSSGQDTPDITLLTVRKPTVNPVPKPSLR